MNFLKFTGVISILFVSSFAFAIDNPKRNPSPLDIGTTTQISNDEEILNKTRNLLDANHTNIHATVEEGVVSLTGTTPDTAKLKSLVETIKVLPGVNVREVKTEGVRADKETKVLPKPKKYNH